MELLCFSKSIGKKQVKPSISCGAKYNGDMKQGGSGECGTEGRGHDFNPVLVRESLTEKIAFEQSPKGGEMVSGWPFFR